jgi:hypothetical protein
MCTTEFFGSLDSYESLGAKMSGTKFLTSATVFWFNFSVEYMAAPERLAEMPDFSLAPRAPSTHGT